MAFFALTGRSSAALCARFFAIPRRRRSENSASDQNFRSFRQANVKNIWMIVTKKTGLWIPKRSKSTFAPYVIFPPPRILTWPSYPHRGASRLVLTALFDATRAQRFFTFEISRQAAYSPGPKALHCRGWWAQKNLCPLGIEKRIQTVPAYSWPRVLFVSPCPLFVLPSNSRCCLWLPSA